MSIEIRGKLTPDERGALESEIIYDREIGSKLLLEGESKKNEKEKPVCL